MLAVSSLSGLRGLPGLVAYSAAKAGVISLAKSLAAELEPQGVGVHVLILGPTTTPMMEVAGTRPRQMEPSDVAETVAWLADLPRSVVLHEIVLKPVGYEPLL